MEYRISPRVGSLQSSAVRDILKLTQGKDMISFAGGLPAEELFPIEAVRAAADRVFSTGKGALQYGLTEGFVPLREQLCGRMAAKQMKVTIDHMLLTTGSQQAIDLLVGVLTEPGDVVLVERPTYLASLQVFALHGLQVVACDSDEHGIIPESASELIAKHKPALLYSVPTFGNPTGRVWSEERRKQILQICTEQQVPILEDDPYGDIKFHEDETYPSMFSMQDSVDGGAVFYTSTFSKTVAPALRTGWIIGDTSVIRMMAKAKQAADLHSSTLDQQVLHQLLAGFDLDAHIAVISKDYKARMLEMDQLLQKQAVDGLVWEKPKGGMFLWAQLPEGLDAEALLKAAVPKGVAFVPGSSFYAREPQRNSMRLNYTYNTGARTEQGIVRLVEAISEFTARS
ncbi:PLP-dependent aminotransferase family protein [Paenibacillus yanchengensis]|uniref:PLP-dependent aminotransferase family protein n=1 Tax=Paenibacillus yanchengensis TaxID=2035833 RepID=A0ABW4YPX0_9BACL